MLLKRTFFIFVSIFSLINLTPLLIGVGYMIRISTGRPICFRQRRPGLYGKPFTLAKFRTMRIPPNRMQSLEDQDAKFLSSTEKNLRSTSLGELLELWNVIKGDIPLVGPRPLLMNYLPRTTQF